MKNDFPDRELALQERINRLPPQRIRPDQYHASIEPEKLRHVENSAPGSATN